MKTPHIYPIVSIALTLVLLGCGRAPGPSGELEVAVRNVQSGALSRDGAKAVIGSAYHGGSYWHLDDRERLFSWNHQAGEMTLLLGADLSPDGGWAATVDDQSLTLWNTQTGNDAGYWRIPSQVLSVDLGRYGNVALLGLENGRAALYNVRGGGIHRSFAHDGPVNSAAISDDLAVAVTGGDDYKVRVWDTESGESRFARSYREPVQLVAVTGDGERAMAAAKYDRVDIFSTRNNDTLWQLPLASERVARGLNITAARFSDDGDYLLTGRPDGIVQLWDISGRAQVYRWQLPKRKAWQPTASPVIDVSFTENANRYRAISGNGFVYTLSY